MPFRKSMYSCTKISTYTLNKTDGQFIFDLLMSLHVMSTFIILSRFYQTLTAFQNH
jgi:hypothetical protein